MDQAGDNSHTGRGTAGAIDPLQITDPERLISFLHERDAPCPLCGYNLRNLTSPRCPECGHLLKLTVTQAEPYLRAWIALMAPLCAGAGLGMFWIMLFLTQGSPTLGPWTWVALFIQMAMIPVLYPAIKGRRSFLRQPRARQWQLAATSIGAFIASMAIAVATIK